MHSAASVGRGEAHQEHHAGARPRASRRTRRISRRPEVQRPPAIRQHGVPGSPDSSLFPGRRAGSGSELAATPRRPRAPPRSRGPRRACGRAIRTSGRAHRLRMIRGRGGGRTPGRCRSFSTSPSPAHPEHPARPRFRPWCSKEGPCTSRRVRARSRPCSRGSGPRGQPPKPRVAPASGRLQQMNRSASFGHQQLAALGLGQRRRAGGQLVASGRSRAARPSGRRARTRIEQGRPVLQRTGGELDRRPRPRPSCLGRVHAHRSRPRPRSRAPAQQRLERRLSGLAGRRARSWAAPPRYWKRGGLAQAQGQRRPAPPRAGRPRSKVSSACRCGGEAIT